MSAKPVMIEGHKYQVKADHRDRTAKKSQWTISVADEHAAFRLAVAEGWIVDDSAWGLHLTDGKAAYLGTAAKNPGPVEDLFFAYFEVQPVCHGYPADHRRSEHERPPRVVQDAWLREELVRPQVVRKIQQGQRCKL